MSAPDTYAGLNYWLKADALSLSDNDPVASWASSAVTSSVAMTQITAGKRATFKADVWNHLPIVRFDGVDDEMQSTTQIGAMVANNLFTIVAVVAPQSGSSQASMWLNDCVFGDRIGFMGMFIKAGPVAWAFNWDGNSDTAGPLTISGPLPSVVMIRHQGGNLYCSVNNGPEVSAPSGNTGSLVGVLTIGKSTSGSTDYLDADVGEVCLYNNGFSDPADRTGLFEWLRDKWVASPSIHGSSLKSLVPSRTTERSS